jgi:hypothetical protein
MGAPGRGGRDAKKGSHGGLTRARSRSGSAGALDFIQGSETFFPNANPRIKGAPAIVENLCDLCRNLLFTSNGLLSFIQTEE